MNIRSLMMVTAVLLVAGCGHSDPADQAATGKGKVRAEQTASTEAVAAVMQSSGTPLARLDFLLLAKPAVGVPVELRLDLSATTTTALRLAAESDGLLLDAASVQADLAIAAGATVSHVLKVTPQKEGLADVTVRLRNEDAETVYAIPVLVSKSGG